MALQLGHRKSIDLDFFGKINFEDIDIASVFHDFKSVKTLKTSSNINVFVINGIKVDFINYSYPWLEKIKEEANLRLAGMKDIAAMKLAAITGRGSRKDFVDIYFLLKQFSLSEMLDFYDQKYFDGSRYMVLKSLTYFDDAEEEPMLEMIQPVEWKRIKQTIAQEVKSIV